MNQKSILRIGNHLSIDHANKNVWHYMAEKLSARGWQVITTSSQQNQALRLLDMLSTVYTQRHEYVLAQIDVFSGKAFIYAEACSQLLKWLGKPMVLTLHGGGLPEFAAKHPVRVKRLLQRADAIVTPSPFLQNSLREYAPDIRLINNPIDISQGIYRQRSAAQPKIIWVRAFHEIYNPEMALKVLAGLFSEFPESHLTMIGPVKSHVCMQSVRTLAKELHVEDHLEIITGVPHAEVSKLLDKADIFLNTSNYDTAPRSILEAMLNGLCVVSTNVGGIPYLGTNNQEFLLVPPGDHLAMANAIRRVLTEPELASRLSSNAHKKAEQDDWGIILPIWEDLFLQIVNHG